MHAMLGGDGESKVELEGRQRMQEVTPALSTKQAKLRRQREKQRAAGKGRVGQHQKAAMGSVDAATSGAGGGKQGQRQAESEGS